MSHVTASTLLFFKYFFDCFIYLFFLKKNTLDFPSSPSTKQALILVLDDQTHCNYSKRKKGRKKGNCYTACNTTREVSQIKVFSM